MKWIEVIELRTVNRDREFLESKLRKLMDHVEKKRKEQRITAYTRVLIDTDFSIHLFHDSKKVENSGSRLGLCLVNALKEFGLVNHRIWVEMHSK
jgi:hypothetical protein